MSDRRPAGRPTVIVCITCRAAADPVEAPLSVTARAGGVLADAALAAVDDTGVHVERVRCLGNCSRGLSAAIRAENTWSYVFGGLDPTEDGPSLIVGAQLLAQAVDGIMPWRGRPDCLKRGLIARIPPRDFRGESA